jgi:hypothetical protein
MIGCGDRYTNHNNMSRGCGVMTTVHNSTTDKGEVVSTVDNNSGANSKENSVLRIQTHM